MKCLCVQVLAALLHALPLREDLEEWVTIGHLFSFLYHNSPDQVTLLLARCRVQRHTNVMSAIVGAGFWPSLHIPSAAVLCARIGSQFCVGEGGASFPCNVFCQ